jgi:CRP/FNR family cyclic AMP-dependent transcriptional regulator
LCLAGRLRVAERLRVAVGRRGPARLTPARPAVSIAPSVGGPMTLSLDRRTELLSGCQLFRGIDADGLAALAARATPVTFPAGHVIARQGEIGTGFFVVIEGHVRVVRDGETVATLGPGDFFGELSVLDRQPRTAMVTADVATTCLALASWDFDAVLLEQPRLMLAILRGVATRLREVSDSTRH